jgi:hypothetical protein
VDRNEMTDFHRRADEHEADLRKVSRLLSYPSPAQLRQLSTPFEQLSKARRAVSAIQSAPPGSYGETLRDPVGMARDGMSALRRRREEAEDQRQREMVSALNALVDLNESMMHQAAESERRHFRLNVASVATGVLGVLAAIVIALAS